MKKQNGIIIGSIVAIVALALIITLLKPSQRVQYSMAPVKKRDIVEVVEASGTVKPLITIDIGTQVSGTIKYLYVDFNSQVKKGQLLAQIDPALFQAQVDRAQSDLNSARANYQRIKTLLDYQKVNYERYSRLYTKHYVSRNDLDLARANYESHLAELNSMEASIKQAQAVLDNNMTNLKYTKISSPVDGVVVTRNVEIGQTVAASFQTPTLFTVAQDLTQMQIEVSVSEADIGKIKEDQKVEYTLDGYSNDIFHGSISQVRISPTTISNVVTYVVVVDVNNDDGKLVPGMSANVSIITKEKKDVLSVPTAATRFAPEEITKGKKFENTGVWIFKAGKPERIEAKFGISDSDFIEIISKDIKEKDKVIIGLNSKNKKRPNSNSKAQTRMFK